MPIGTPKVMRLALTAAAMLISACAPLATPAPGATPRPDQLLVRPDHAVTSGGANAIAAGGGNLVGQAGSNLAPAPAVEQGMQAPASGAVPVIDAAALNVTGGATTAGGATAIAVGGGNVGVAIEPDATLIGQAGTNLTAPEGDVRTRSPGISAPDGEETASSPVKVE